MSPSGWIGACAVSFGRCPRLRRSGIPTNRLAEGFKSQCAGQALHLNGQTPVSTVPEVLAQVGAGTYSCTPAGRTPRRPPPCRPNGRTLRVCAGTRRHTCLHACLLVPLQVLNCTIHHACELLSVPPLAQGRHRNRRGFVPQGVRQVRRVPPRGPRLLQRQPAAAGVPAVVKGGRAACVCRGGYPSSMLVLVQLVRARFAHGPQAWYALPPPLLVGLACTLPTAHACCVTSRVRSRFCWCRPR